MKCNDPANPECRGLGISCHVCSVEYDAEENLSLYYQPDDQVSIGGMLPKGARGDNTRTMSLMICRCCTPVAILYDRCELWHGWLTNPEEACGGVWLAGAWTPADASFFCTPGDASTHHLVEFWIKERPCIRARNTVLDVQTIRSPHADQIAPNAVVEGLSIYLSVCLGMCMLCICI